MELTMIRRFVNLNQLRGLVLDSLDSLPSAIELIAPIFSKLCGAETLDTLNYILPNKPSPKSSRNIRLPKPVYTALLHLLNSTLPLPYQSVYRYPIYEGQPVLSPLVERIRWIVKNDRRFSSYRQHRGNSHVFVLRDSNSPPFVGRIDLIIRCYEQRELGEDNVFVAIRPFKNITTSSSFQSPWLGYKDVRMNLVTQTLLDSIFIPLSRILCHVAVTPIKAGAIRGVKEDIYGCIRLHDAVA